LAISLGGDHADSGSSTETLLASPITEFLIRVYPRLSAVRFCLTNPGGTVGLMADTVNPESFEQIVEWAYGTLPQKIRRLPDFPGIQVVDEPPPEVLQEMGDREKWRHGTELLGLYSGTLRTKRSFTQLKYAPDLIFVFRGPILRCSKGDLRAEVKRVVWHEVAHWLGYETEEQVEALGL
jgi:predicted Zn-dependent protease with MMP-like domain